MPAIAPGTNALVLVTGANGYIAVHVVRELLEKGYRVRGTVRREIAIAHLRKTFASYGDKLQLVIVPDIIVVCFACSCQSDDKLRVCRKVLSMKL
jgi:uncharacterized protein YbjT (DUF2867 family)